MKKIYVYLQYPKLIFADIMYHRYKTDEIDADILTFLPKSKKELIKNKKTYALNYLLLTNVAFRNVFYFRMPKEGYLRIIGRILIPPAEWIEIGPNGGSIKGGLRLLHKASVVIAPHDAGKNFTVAQGATIGSNLGSNGKIGAPVIGDNVFVGANAVVVGNITIGDNVVVGAGSIVTKSIPSNCVVVGNPARIIKRNE